MTPARRTLPLIAALVLWLASAGTQTLAQATAPPPHTDPRGIYVGGAKLGVSAEIEIERGATRGMVPSTFEFRSGDRFWLHLTVNKDSYIYVLNRTLTGSHATTRGIKLLADADRNAKTPPPDTYTLVFPGPNMPPQRVRPAISTVVPGAGAFFAMDQVPGAEKLLVLASETPIDLARYFDGTTGRLIDRSAQTDGVETILNRLNAELQQMADNAATDYARSTRSIAIVDAPARPPAPKPNDAAATPSPSRRTSGARLAAPAERKAVSVVKQPGKPLLLELTLAHVGG